jgi:hypothetical protein
MHVHAGASHISACGSGRKATRAPCGIFSWAEQPSGSGIHPRLYPNPCLYKQASLHMREDGKKRWRRHAAKNNSTAARLPLRQGIGSNAARQTRHRGEKKTTAGCCSALALSVFLPSEKPLSRTTFWRARPCTSLLRRRWCLMYPYGVHMVVRVSSMISQAHRKQSNNTTRHAWTKKMGHTPIYYE